jgi:hypothetical protein
MADPRLRSAEVVRCSRVERRLAGEEAVQSRGQRLGGSSLIVG